MQGQTAPDLAKRLHDLIRSGEGSAPTTAIKPSSSPFWAGLAATRTRLWLDTGDMHAAEASWTSEFGGLTTNNTLLNKEIQTGSYDSFVPTVAKLLGGMEERQAVLEIAFALNARHGLRLVSRFGSWVSVELHTDLAHDTERSIAYGIRYHAICPERFIVKIPMTPAGLIAARALGERGIPVNLTLGFSARHNFLTTAVARPKYVNVFLGRLNAYVGDHKLGDPAMVGEKARWASQSVVRELDQGAGRTLQIAASLREPAQLETLAGVDVITMPTPVATGGIATLSGTWKDHSANPLEVRLNDAKAIRSSTLWEISAAERAIDEELRKRPAATGAELQARLQAGGCGDIFPRFSATDLAAISGDGKIPKHARWADRIASGELAIDTLLNHAALASFTVDQAALDARIRAHMKG